MSDYYQNIPVILKQRPNWVVWGIPGAIPKAPYHPESLLRMKINPAKAGAPDTWGSYNAAAECVKRELAQGVGYEFDGGGIYGVDLDKVIDNSGALSPQAREIVDGLASYTEISPSGRGLHIFVTADNVNITRHRRQGGFVEIYSNARYFTVTGNVYGGFDRIADRPAELQRLHDRYLLPEPSQILQRVDSARTEPDFLRRGLAKDTILRACWNGERRRGEESADDIGLMNKWAYWCNKDHAAMIAAFMQSPYYAGKDDDHKKKCQRSDYLPKTAAKACAALRSTAREDTQRYRQAKSRERAR
jgi:putative DNA primase/helicase